MGDFVKVARKDELEPGTGKTVDVGGTPVALFNVGGTYYAVHNTCRHRGGPLGEGELADSVVTCPWHGWRYDVTTGEKHATPEIRVSSYEVRVEGDDILVAKEALNG
jgi:nitrite reductase/ring-hydroxylating ferredoxin subunit